MFKQPFFLLILLIFTRAHNPYARNLFPILTVQPDKHDNHHHGDEAHDHREGEQNHTHPEDIHEHTHTHVIDGEGSSHNHVHDHSLGEHSDHNHENDWVKCADEYGICACKGIVRFGFNRTFANYRVQLPRNMGSRLGNESNTTVEIACNMRSFAMDRNCINEDEADFPYESEKICECKGILNPNKILDAVAEKKWFPTWAAVLSVIFGIVLFCGVTSRSGLKRKYGLEFDGPIDAERRASLIINSHFTQSEKQPDSEAVWQLAINKSAVDSFGI